MLSVVRLTREGKNEIVIGRDVRVKIKHVYDRDGRELYGTKVVVCVEAPQGAEILRGELLNENQSQSQNQRQKGRVDRRDYSRYPGGVRQYKRS